MQTCLENADGCLEWSAPTACAEGQCRNARQCADPGDVHAVCANECTSDAQCFAAANFVTSCAAEADCKGQVCVLHAGLGYCVPPPDPAKGCGGTPARGPLPTVMPRVGGGSATVCVLPLYHLYCSKEGRCAAHPCYDDADCGEHNACVGFGYAVERNEETLDVKIMKKGDAKVTYAKNDVTAGQCHCTSDAACVAPYPLCNGTCRCAIAGGKDTCDPEGLGGMRCLASGDCGCASDNACHDPSLPHCAPDGRCVCANDSCREGMRCQEGTCVCDSDEACVAMTGGYHSLCIEGQCGCASAAACATVGPPALATGIAEIDQALPQRRFATHPATTLVCE
jgi:hypothetical protein